MRNNSFGSLKITVIFIINIAILTSCLPNNKKAQEQEFIQRIEKFNSVTNKYCSSLGLDYSDNNPIRVEMFFRCKIELAKRAEISNPTKPREIIFNGDLKNYIKMQDHEYMDAIEKLNYHRNSILNNIHHKECQKRGYKIDTLRQEEIEDYLSCRESILMSFDATPAYQTTQDLNYNQSSYNVAYIVNEKQDKEIAKHKEFSKDYPHCSPYKVNSEKAIQCKNDYDNQESCLQQVRTESFARKRRFHEICQQKLYIKLPDSLLIEKDKKKTKAQERNFNTDLYLNSSYYQLLSDQKFVESFMAKDDEKDQKDKKDKKTQKEEEQEKAKEINNSFKKLYTKNELVSLRKKFILSCTSKIKPKVANFVDAGNKICYSLTLKWEKNKK